MPDTEKTYESFGYQMVKKNFYFYNLAKKKYSSIQTVKYTKL